MEKQVRRLAGYVPSPLVNEQKVSVAQFKKLLPAGAEFVATFIGPVNTKMFGSDRVTRRRVLKQGREMKTLMLDGPKKDHSIYLDWGGVRVRKDGDAYILSMEFDFLRIEGITIPQPVT